MVSRCSLWPAIRLLVPLRPRRRWHIIISSWPQLVEFLNNHIYYLCNWVHFIEIQRVNITQPTCYTRIGYWSLVPTSSPQVIRGNIFQKVWCAAFSIWRCGRDLGGIPDKNQIIYIYTGPRLILSLPQFSLLFHSLSLFHLFLSLSSSLCFPPMQDFAIDPNKSLTNS